MRARLVIALALLLCAACRSTPAGNGNGAAGAYEVQFEGNAQLSSRTLSGAVSLDLKEFESSGFEEAFVDDAAFAATLRYHEEGFPFAEVTYSIEPRPEGPLVTFRVQEGPRTLLTGIETEIVPAPGDQPVFTAEETKAFFEGPRTGLLGRGELLYLADRVKAAPGKAREAYLQRGYLDVKVTPPEVGFKEDRSVASVKMRIEQGPRYRVGRVEPTEDSMVPEEGLEPGKIEEELEKIRRVGNDARPYAPRLPFELRGTLLELLGNAGYPDAVVDVQPHVDSESARVRLDVRVRPGVRVKVTGARFEGNERTRPRFLRSRLTLGKRVKPKEEDKGEEEPETEDEATGAPEATWFSNKEQRRSVRRLYETGLFRSVTVELEDSDAAERELVVRVDEAPSLEAYVEPGYGSYELFRLKAGVREKNLFGSGLQLRAGGTVAVRALRAEVGLTDPWFLGRDLIGDLKLSYEQREEPSFTSESTGLGAFVTKRWSDPWSTTFGYQFRRSTVKDVQIDVDQLPPGEAETLQDALEDVDISSLRVSQRFDKRNNPFFPTKGGFAEVSLEYGDGVLGSQLDFTRATLFLSGYRDLREDSTVLATALRAGVIVPHGSSTTIPLQERFFNGGENSVRSYMESELGPQDDSGEPLGGEAFSTLNVELRQRLTGGLQGALFVDVGNVVSDYTDLTRFIDLGTAVGVGVRYLLPVGPLRLDLGVNPDPDEGEDDYVIQFAIGMAF